jgi:hypothetical protein
MANQRADADSDHAQVRVWCLGRASLALWSVLIYLLIIAAFTVPRLWTLGIITWPLYAPDEYIKGSYPFMWLVYICMPLLARDIYLHRKMRQPLSADLKAALWLAALSSVPAYTVIFGWL